jgi:hypothetical protein
MARLLMYIFLTGNYHDDLATAGELNRQIVVAIANGWEPPPAQEPAP